MSEQREEVSVTGAVPGLESDNRVTRDRRNEEVRRPRYVLEGHEDEVYHDLPSHLGARATNPEYHAFVGKSWVFNRAMCWTEAPGDTLICHSAGGDLGLTGGNGVSEWFSDPVNIVTADDDGGSTRFLRRSQRRRDCVVLPAFQFNIEQHPKVRLAVTEATSDWQFCVLMKGRAGAPLLASPWQTGPGESVFDLHTALRDHGFALHFPELFFVIGTWSTEIEAEASVHFS